jgi:hypothetical protein
MVSYCPEAFSSGAGTVSAANYNSNLNLSHKFGYLIDSFHQKLKY